MKCDISKEKLIAYFYDDLDSHEKKSIDEHLASCSQCQSELEQFGQTTKILQTWSDEDANLHLNFVKEKSGWLSFQTPAWIKNWRRPILGFAGAVAATLFILSLFNFEASYQKDNFDVKMSLWPRSAPTNLSNPGIESELVSRSEFDDWKKNSFQLMQEMLEETEARQRAEHNLLLSEFAKEIDNQRKQDLRLVGQGFEVFRLSNEDEFRRTNQVIHKLIQSTQNLNFKPRNIENK